MPHPGEWGSCASIAVRAAIIVVMSAALVACSSPKEPPTLVHTVVAPPPLPPPPWRDAGSVPNATGVERWTDASRDRIIVGQWTAPRDGGRVLLLVLPGLAQGSSAPPSLVGTLVDAGFVVLVVGHPGNDAEVWQSPEARRADFRLAARRMYAFSEVTDRAADVRFALDSLARQPPPWMPAKALEHVGVIGIGLGAQTAQFLLGEQMTRDAPPVRDARIAAAALVAPYVGFEGPGMNQRYAGITTPLLIAYGLTETDPNGLGMTAQQRRAMVDALKGASVVEVRLPAAALASMQTVIFGPSVPREGPTLPPLPRGEGPGQSGRAQKGGPTTQSGDTADPGPMFGAGPGSGGGRNEQVARAALIFSVSAFFEWQLLRNADAREWLEGPHPGPVLWAALPAGRTERPAAAR